MGLGTPRYGIVFVCKSHFERRGYSSVQHGHMIRDFTYIEDIIEGVTRVLDKPASPNSDFDPNVPDPATSCAPYRVFNIGNGTPVQLMDYIGALEQAFDVEAIKEFLPMQPGDVPATSADTRELFEWIGFKPNTPIVDGVAKFAEWYRDFYNV